MRPGDPLSTIACRDRHGREGMGTGGTVFGVYFPTNCGSGSTPSVGPSTNKEVREVKHQFRSWRLAVRGLALALVLAAIPLPCLAGETNKPAPAPGLKASIARAAASGSVTLEQAKPAATPDKAQLGSPSFFKRPAGMIVLAVVAAGTGYALYSVSRDRIHSVIRQNQ